MKLDSVRELKQSLMRSMLSPAEVAARSRAVGVARRAAESVIDHRGVALGVSPRRKADYALAVRVQHRGYENSDYIQRIRAKARGEIDLAYVGRIVKRAVPGLQDENRPLRIGCSVGHFRITAGTLGCIVRNSAGDVMILSNNHVLADENRARKGDSILQPGTLDGGKRPGSVVAGLKAFTRLKKRGVNLVDCATAVVKDGIDFDPGKLRGIGALTGAGELLPEHGRVAKVGRTTGTTRGKITAFDLDNVAVEYDLGDLRFDNQIEIEGAGTKAFSDGGDSGSLIVNSEGQGVALLFAGTDEGGTNGKGVTYANPLNVVLSAMEVTLVF